MGKVSEQMEQKRRAKFAKRNTQTWEDLEEVYTALAEGVGVTAVELFNIVKKIQEEKIPTTAEFNISINGISRDLNDISKDLATIHDAHKQYSGPIKDQDELALCLSLFTDYANLGDLFNSVTFNPMLTVSEFLASVVADKEVVNV